MSKDDEIDYRMMYPVEGRNRKRRSANPRPQKKAEPRAGFFRGKPQNPPTKDRVKKASTPTPRTRERQYDYEDGPPMPSMTTPAREMWAKNLDLSVDDVIERLEAMGYEAAPITISAIKQEIFKILLLCQKHRTIMTTNRRTSTGIIE
jgi:hypothetical protein